MEASSSMARRIVLLAMLLVSVGASADVYTYNYVGNALVPFVGSPPGGLTHIDATFTTAGPISSDLQMTFNEDTSFQQSNVNFLSFSLSDGVSTFSDQTAGLFYLQVQTDSSGTILRWAVIALDNPLFEDSNLIFGSVDHPTIGTYDASCRGAAPACNNFNFLPTDAGDTSVNTNSPGVWTVTHDSGAEVPEPSSILLLGTGLLSVAASAKRRFRA